MLRDGILYKRGYSHPLLCCLAPKEANYVWQEMHEGITRLQQGTKAILNIAMRQEYYWPTMLDHTKTLVQLCRPCQEYQHAPSGSLVKQNPILIFWPFT